MENTVALLVGERRKVEVARDVDRSTFVTRLRRHLKDGDDGRWALGVGRERRSGKPSLSRVHRASVWVGGTRIPSGRWSWGERCAERWWHGC